MEKTFVMIKPGGVQRNLIGEIIRRIEQKGFTICAIKLINVTKEQAQKHYDVHSDKHFYNDLVNSLLAGPVVAMVVSGKECVNLMRILAGATDPLKAQPGSIRGDFSSDIRLNLIHTADAIDRAKYEINIYFDENEICQYEKSLNQFTIS